GTNGSQHRRCAAKACNNCNILFIEAVTRKRLQITDKELEAEQGTRNRDNGHIGMCIKLSQKNSQYDQRAQHDQATDGNGVLSGSHDTFAFPHLPSGMISAQYATY